MPKVKTRAIVYRNGIVKSHFQKSIQANAKNAKYKGINTQCDRCKRFYVNPKMQHYVDFKNKIRCF